MNDFLCSNEWQWRLLRTVAQGVLGVLAANVDLLVGAAVLDPAWRALVVALVMAVLSPVMAEIGAVCGGGGAGGAGCAAGAAGGVAGSGAAEGGE
jgi:hypothetical protein